MSQSNSLSQGAIGLVPRLLHRAEIGTYLGISTDTADELIAAGIIPTVKVPRASGGSGRTMRRVLVDRLDLDRLIDEWKSADRNSDEPGAVPVQRRGRGRPRGSTNKNRQQG